MAVLVLCSPVGSPGATTTALGLALGWPRDVLLADCDRDPSQAVLYRGAGLEVVAPRLAVLAMLGAAFLGVTFLRLRRSLAG